MTTAEMISEVRAALGNRTDISDERYLRWLNWALLDLCGFHRRRVFPSKRFHELEKLAVLNVGPIHMLSDAGSTTTEVMLVPATSQYIGDMDTDEPAFEALAIEFDGEVRRVIRVNDEAAVPSVVVDEPFPDPPPPASELTFYIRRYLIQSVSLLSSKDELWAIERITRMDGTPLEFVTWQELINLDAKNTGIPTKYSRHGNFIMFDTAPDEDVRFYAYVYIYPHPLSLEDMDGRTNLSVIWDEIIVLGAVYRGFQRLMEPDRAEQAREEYIYEATNKMGSHQIEEGFIPRGMKVRT